jgi:hypothetical protein
MILERKTIMRNNFTPAEEEIELTDNWSEQDIEDLVTFALSQLDPEIANS